ncbi:MAG: flagellar basal body P-ring protein FlgI [Betaproteobacteria bacterium]|uniref:Flagellar P-ring protein n=1 Tax=Candidatus Proximibacter danicus TaxID=2954365 RepID=A0A9D7JZJ8_9PROT|nr:flagellar basal body P-ring protein FlgI [Candidatus Proximibacter danicus]
MYRSRDGVSGTRSGLAGKYLRQAAILACLASTFASFSVHAERIKDIATVQGIRHNQLIGYGLVVGLDGSGDQTTQTPFTTQAMLNMLSQMGANLPLETASTIQLKNVAAVMVTASLPAFSRPGQGIDVTISSIGNAKSLRGGTLLMTPLKGADGQVYAMAQGNILVGGAGASSGGNKAQVNHLSAGRIAGGATVERSVPTPVGQGQYVNYELNQTDFGTAKRMVEVINREMGSAAGPVAEAVDGRRIRVMAPESADARVAFMGRVENLEVQPMQSIAKVIVNPRTGSVVMNQAVTLENCAVAHGNLSVVVSTDPSVSQPGALSGGQTVVTNQTDIQIKQDAGALMNVKAGANLSDVVKALNALGANPQDLLAILQAMKAAGALRADLEII